MKKRKQTKNVKTSKIQKLKSRRKVAKRKSPKNVPAPKRARKNRINQKTKEVRAGQVKLDLAFQMLEDIEKLEQQEIINSQNKSKRVAKSVKIKTKQLRRMSLVDGEKYYIKVFEIKFSKKNYYDLTNLDNRDTDKLFLYLEPYFTKIYNRVKKHPVYFINKILYFDLFDQVISHSKQDADIIPDEFYRAAKELCGLLVAKAEEYELKQNGAPLDVTGVAFQTYRKKK